MTIEVRRAAGRFVTRAHWLESRHSFSYGAHYDPTNTHHGLLLASNDDVVRPGAGFATHPHRDLEIVTWVLDGALAHADSLGNDAVLRPGLVQWLSAGTGVEHRETNPSADAPLRYVQMWVRPDALGAAPAYRLCEADLDSGGLRAVVHTGAATLHAGRLAPGDAVPVPGGPYVHLYVARGDAALEGAGDLAEGDAVRLTAAGAPVLTAGLNGAEILVWATG